jgi:predicted O-methyltransferase YrrM
MRLRWLALGGGTGWLALVVVVALVSDLGGASAVLFAALGLLVVAGLVLLLSLHKRLADLAARRPRAAAPQPGQAPTSAPLDDAAVARLAGAVDQDLKRTFRQVEALQNLYAMIDIKHALPASRGWPASPDLLLFLVDLVDRHRPRVVVECGSGLSTLCLALAMRRFGIDGKVIALEHLEQYADQTRELLQRHGVADLAEVRTAPLETVEVGDISVGWYARAAWEDLEAVDLLFVDGPPSKLSPHSRYPSLPLFTERLTPGAHIVLDDYQRAKERDVVKRWQDEYADRLTLERIPLEKGAALLTFA